MEAPDDPISLVAELLRSGDDRVSAPALGPTREAAIAMLIRAGLLVPDGIIDTVICDECTESHLADVILDQSTTSYGWWCPEVGFVASDAASVAAFSINRSRVVDLLGEALTNAFGSRRWRPRSLVGSDAWIVGVWRVAGASTTVVLVRNLEFAPVARQIGRALAALVQNEAGLILTTGDDVDCDGPERYAVLPLGMGFMLNPDGQLVVDTEVVARAVVPHAGRHRVARSGRPAMQAQIFEVIDRLVQRGVPATAVNATVVTKAWFETFPNQDPPSIATCRRHIRSWRDSR